MLEDGRQRLSWIMGKTHAIPATWYSLAWSKGGATADSTGIYADTSSPTRILIQLCHSIDHDAPGSNPCPREGGDMAAVEVGDFWHQPAEQEPSRQPWTWVQVSSTVLQHLGRAGACPTSNALPAAAHHCQPHQQHSHLTTSPAESLGWG